MTDDLQNVRDHVIVLADPSRLDEIGFKVRRAGLEIRDCLIVQRSKGPVCGFLVRREPDSTVVDSVLRRNQSVIDIDRSRIDSSGDHKRPYQPTNNERDIYGEQAGFMPSNKDGRFPTNFILVHGPDCERADADDGEAGWECQTDCPVLLLDEQSGTLKSGFMEAGVEYTNNSATYGRPSGATQMDTYGDEGGAARFFKQVQSEDELDEYLNALIRQKE